jgi:histidinol phosphatase-like PHP family hydrolase
MEIQHDVHMHTYLSRCSNDPCFLPPAIIDRSKTNGIKLLGFSDHFWDKTMPGGDNAVYRNQDYKHVTKIHRMMPEEADGIKLMFGCETEYYGKGRIGISKEIAEKFDYVLVPTNHTLTAYAAEEGLSKPGELAKELVTRFKEVLSFDVASGICHPFLPLGFMEIGDEILNSISREELNECFSMAKEKSVSIELNSCTFASNFDRGTNGFTDDSFMRIFRIAKETGCKFHFGSDAHSLEDIDRLQKLRPFIDELELTDDDINPLFSI